MKKIYFCLLTLIFLSFPVLVSAQEVYDLKKVLETGLEKNYDIRIVRNEQQISDNNVSWGNAGFLPTIDINAGYSGSVNDTEREYIDESSVKTTGVFDQGANLGLNLSWTIFDGFSMQTNYDRLKEFREIGSLNTQLAVEGLISNLVAEYYNYVCQKIRLKNLQYAVSLSKERLRIVEAHYQIGSKSKLDLQQARVDFNADSSRLMTQFETLYTSGVTLNQLMALDDVSETLVVSDSLISPNPFLEKEILWEQTLAHNSRLLLSDRNKKISELDYKAIRSRDYPYLRLNAGYGYTLSLYDISDPKRIDNLGFNYGFSVGFNIFEGFNRRREKKNAKIAIQNQELQRDQLELSLKADLANMWMSYRNNLDLVNLERQNKEVAMENYEIAMERYRLGDLAGIELREAQNSLLEADERLLQAEYNTKLCEISLLQLSGQATYYLE